MTPTESKLYRLWVDAYTRERRRLRSLHDDLPGSAEMSVEDASNLHEMAAKRAYEAVTDASTREEWAAFRDWEFAFEKRKARALANGRHGDDFTNRQRAPHRKIPLQAFAVGGLAAIYANIPDSDLDGNDPTSL